MRKKFKKSIKKNVNQKIKISPIVILNYILNVFFFFFNLVIYSNKMQFLI